ncbi:MAG: DNA-binding domain-containing protein [Rhodobacter sp.]|nr:DNA-binding domain-containing protein [Rhodobacter sp.]
MQSALIAPHQVRPQDVAERLKPSNRLSAAERLGIYQSSYIARLCACLAEQFPASRHALGPQLFDQFARLYLSEVPSDSYTLHELGRRFPSYLQETRPDGDASEAEQEAWVNFMIDLATYERSLFVLFDAPGHEGKPWPTPETPDAALVLQPCFTLGAFRFPVAQYYHDVTAESDPYIPPIEPSYVAIARHDYLTASFPISHMHHAFLAEVQSTQSIDMALRAVANRLNAPLSEVRKVWTDDLRERWINNHFFVARNI